MLRKSLYKDLDKWAKTARSQKRRYYGRTAYADNGGQAWTENEIDIVMKHEKPDREIASEIGRSVQAIQIMRCKIKKSLDNANDLYDNRH